MTSICGRYKIRGGRRWGRARVTEMGVGAPGGAGLRGIGQSADLGIAVTGSPDPANVGSNLTYTITVTNNVRMRRPKCRSPTRFLTRSFVS